MATIITKNSQTASAVPSAASLAVGELAVNTADGKLYTEHTGGVVKEIIPSTVVDGGITTAKIATNAVTSDKINASAVTTAKIADANVTIAKLSATGTPSSSTFLRGDGVWGAAGAVVNVQTFTSSGTWTKPSTGTMCAVFLIGGGGGGGRTNTNPDYTMGGGAGSFPSFAIFNLADLSSTVSVTVGSGGAGSGSGGSPGGNGGNTSFGGLITSLGGIGGTSFNGVSFPTPPSRTISSLPQLTIYGGAGLIGRVVSSGLGSDNGGFSGAASGADSANNAGTAGQNYFGTGGAASTSGTGYGSGGGASPNATGGNGAPGLCRVVVW